MLFQVEADEPAGDLLRGPLSDAAVLPLMLLRELSLLQNLNADQDGREEADETRKINRLCLIVHGNA